MNNKYFIILILILISVISCTEEQIYNTIIPTVNISKPENNFLIEEYDSLYIQVATNVNESEIEKIELIINCSDIFEDTVTIILYQKTFETYLYIPKICVESSYMLLSTNLTLKSGEVKNSETIWGRVIKNLPSNDELNVYNYEGFDNDSVIVAQGNLYIAKGYWPPGFDNTLRGRRDINVVTGDSTFEAGKGFLEGFIKQNGSYSIYLLPCYELGGFKDLVLYGSTYSDSLLFGSRVYFYDSGPVGKIVGSFRAVKIN
jgi:hypothetical protein